MNKKILWIDDDYYAIQGLFRPIEKEGFKLEVAISALDGYRKAHKWKDYDLIVVDLIIPIAQQQETAPDIVNNWDNVNEHEYVGIGLAKWLLKDMKVTCPVLILSVVPDPVSTYKLENLGLAGHIQKSGLLPSTLKDELLKIIQEKK